MANEVTIPILPCHSINETLEFYVALGFEVTYQQKRPNNYGCVKYGDIDLHFFTLKGYEPKDSYSTCFVLVPDLAKLHQIFNDGVRSYYGRRLIAGIPRISKLNDSNSDKQLRFNIVDPGGNWIRFAEMDGKTSSESDTSNNDNVTKSKLTRATQAADWLVEAKGDFEKAAQMLDSALAQAESASAVDRIEAWVLRASLAISLDDPQFARTLLQDVQQIPLDAQERDTVADALQRADDMEKMLEQ